MRNKILGSVLVVLTVLGGIQLVQNIKAESARRSGVDVMADAPNVSSDRIVSEVQTRVVRRIVDATSSSEVMIEKTFKVGKGDNLRMDIEHADVEIETGNGSEASIVVTLDSRNMSKARERFEDMEWEVYQEGSAVYVRAESPKGNWRNSWSVNMNVDVVIRIPSEFNLDLTTSHGDVHIGDVMGTVSVLTSHGDVDFTSITGDEVWIKSSHGDIEGGSVSASTLNLKTSHADIQVREVDARLLNASTSHADIQIGYLNGEADISTSHGDIELFVTGNGRLSMETQHGDIELALEGGSGMDLDLRGPNIKLDRNLNLKGERSKNRVNGSVNGGGRTIEARTTHGSIELRSR